MGNITQSNEIKNEFFNLSTHKIPSYFKKYSFSVKLIQAVEKSKFLNENIVT